MSIKTIKKIYSNKQNIKTIKLKIEDKLNISRLNIPKLKQIYKDVLSQYILIIKTFKIRILIKFILNYYLLLKGYRNIFQIEYGNDDDIKLLETIFLNKYDIKYVKKQKRLSLHFYKRIIVYNPNTFNIDNMNVSLGKEFANQLGEFYVCAGNSGLSNRIFIRISNYTLNIDVELYSQMCNNESINETNMNKLKKIVIDIRKLLKTFDKNLITELIISNNKTLLGIPYKIKKINKF